MPKSTFIILCIMVISGFFIIGALLAQAVPLLGFMTIVFGFLVVGSWYFVGVLR